MHRRFARARRVELRFAEHTLEVAVADGFCLRLLGLMRLEQKEVEPLLFARCRSIHTYGMRTPIDLVWIAIEGERARVLGVVGGLDPGRHARAPQNGSPRGKVAALELPAGDAQRLGLAAEHELRIG